MNRFVSRLVSIVLVAVGFFALTDRASAAVRPYKATGTARLVGLDLVGQGQASHLGRYTEAGVITSIVPISEGVLAVTAETTYTTDEGYELRASATGTLNFGAGTISGTLTYHGGTGRFANASGSSSLSGRILEDGQLAVTVSGNINY